MANALGLSDPFIIVNNAQIEYVPNTLEYQLGEGDRKVETQTAGGGLVSVVVTEDATTNKSMVKFEMRATLESFEMVDAWTGLGANHIILADQASGFKQVFSFMTMVNHPSRKLAADGKVECEFHGARAD